MLPFPSMNPALTPRDPYWSSVVCLVPCSGTNGDTTFPDVGPNALSVTVFGNSQVSSAQTLFGANTGLFDGSGDYLTPDDTTLSSVGNETDKTLEAWIYMTTISRTNTILNKRATTSASEFSFSVSASNVLNMACYRSGSAVLSIVGAATLSANTWYHVAAVRTDGANWKTYVDGVEDGSGTESNQPTGNAVNLRIARDNFNTGRDFTGHLAEVRYTNAARYTSNFTRPVAAFPRS
jgi:hypothetical protein